MIRPDGKKGRHNASLPLSFLFRARLGLRRRWNVYVRLSRDRRDVVHDDLSHLGVFDVPPYRLAQALVEGGGLLVGEGALLGLPTLELGVGVLPALLQELHYPVHALYLIAPPPDQAPHLVQGLAKADRVASGTRLLYLAPGGLKLSPELWGAPHLVVLPGLLDHRVDLGYGLAVVGELGVVDEVVEVLEELCGHVHGALAVLEARVRPALWGAPAMEDAVLGAGRAAPLAALLALAACALAALLLGDLSAFVGGHVAYSSLLFWTFHGDEGPSTGQLASANGVTPAPTQVRIRRY